MVGQAGADFVGALRGCQLWQGHDYGAAPAGADRTLQAEKLEELTWGVDDVARVVKKSRPVVHRLLKSNPDLLPPPARRVGRTFLWLPEQVMEWLSNPGAEALAEAQNKPRRPRGRPRKDARRSTGGAA